MPAKLARLARLVSQAEATTSSGSTLPGVTQARLADPAHRHATSFVPSPTARRRLVPRRGASPLANRPVVNDPRPRPGLPAPSPVLASTRPRLPPAVRRRRTIGAPRPSSPRSAATAVTSARIATSVSSSAARRAPSSTRPSSRRAVRPSVAPIRCGPFLASVDRCRSRRRATKTSHRRVMPTSRRRVMPTSRRRSHRTRRRSQRGPMTPSRRRSPGLSTTSPRCRSAWRRRPKAPL